MEYDQKILFSDKMRVRVSDINYGNHVCHTKFISMLHNVRVLFFKKYGYSEGDFFGNSLVMLNVTIDYLAQCFFDEELIISITSVGFQKAALCFEYEIFNSTRKAKAVKATSIMGLYDKASNSLKRPPKECVEFLTSFRGVWGF
jgi:acyl-CoA thioester hydrolase